jgi:hypothetical protein
MARPDPQWPAFSFSNEQRRGNDPSYRGFSGNERYPRMSDPREFP